MIEETGADYLQEIIEYGETMKSDAFLKINPMGKVPAIMHKGNVITECPAICANDYIAGERFSAADVYVGSHVMWGMMFGTIEKRPEFEAYVAKLNSRAAYKTSSAIDIGLMK